MPRSIEGVQHKPARADEHFAAFETEAASFFKSSPYAVDRHDDPSAGDVWTVTRAQNPPLRLAAMLGDGFHNLRAALDHLAWGLVEAGGGKPSWRTQFPILGSRKHFNAKVKQSLEGASSAVVGAVRALEPWKGGNHALHRLHYLDIADKHRLLLTVGTFVRDSYLPPGVPKGSRLD